MSQPSSQNIPTPSTSQGVSPRKRTDPLSQPSSVHPVITEEKRLEFNDWLSTLYDPSLMMDNDLAAIYESARYKGFNRDLVLKKLQDEVKDPKLVVEAIIVCALRGPQSAQQIILSNGRSLKQMNIPGSGGQGQEFLTCNKIVSATADLAAFYLKKLGVTKRVPSNPLPAWLQFPSAGSIKMPTELRELHVEFHKQFSKMIGGVFNDQIYSTMASNAYLDERLHLFN